MAESLGMVEVRGLSSALVAANIAANTAAVTIAGFGYLHEGQIMITIRGSIDAVQAAVEAIVSRLGSPVVTSSSVIGRVSPALEPVLGERVVPVGARVGAPVVRGRGRGRGRSRPQRNDPSPASGAGSSTDSSVDE